MELLVPDLPATTAASGAAVEIPPRRDPLRAMFVITTMPVGGAETLLVELIRRLDRRRFAPELCCLKYFDVLGEVLAQEVPAFTGLLRHKYDFAVLPRLARLMRKRRIRRALTFDQHFAAAGFQIWP